MREFHNFINGKFVPSSGTARIVVKNPATGEVICSVPNSTQQDVDDALTAAVEGSILVGKTTCGRSSEAIEKHRRKNPGKCGAPGARDHGGAR